MARQLGAPRGAGAAMARVLAGVLLSAEPPRRAWHPWCPKRQGGKNEAGPTLLRVLFTGKAEPKLLTELPLLACCSCLLHDHCAAGAARRCCRARSGAAPRTESGWTEPHCDVCERGVRCATAPGELAEGQGTERGHHIHGPALGKDVSHPGWMLIPNDLLWRLLMGGTAPRGHGPWCLLSQGDATFSCGNGKRKLLTVPRGAVCKWPFVCLGFHGLPAGRCCLQACFSPGLLQSLAAAFSFGFCKLSAGLRIPGIAFKGKMEVWRQLRSWAVPGTTPRASPCVVTASPRHLVPSWAGRNPKLSPDRGVGGFLVAVPAPSAARPSPGRAGKQGAARSLNY